MLNYRHLYYFWVVAKEASYARAAERLGMAIQTISAQVHALEASLGHQLLLRARRGVLLTAAGQAAFRRAEEIFRLGEGLPLEIQEAASQQVLSLVVGLSDGISKLAAHALLAPILSTPSLKLVCHEGEFDPLLAELALHRLDLVVAEEPAPGGNSAIHSERVVEAAVDWYGPAHYVNTANIAQFPSCLQHLPVLLPTAHSALRLKLQRWFESEALRPRVVGEFEDSALMAVFAARGLGVFPVSRLGPNDVRVMRGLRLLGHCESVREEIYAIRSRRGLHHPLVQRVVAAASRISTSANGATEA